ncbi:MAG: hypothetical protein ACYDD5_00100, partial [Sulfuricurvum sp.]
MLDNFIDKKIVPFICKICSSTPVYISKRGYIPYCSGHSHLIPNNSFQWKLERFFYYIENTDLQSIEKITSSYIENLIVDSTIFDSNFKLLSIIEYMKSEFSFVVTEENFKRLLLESKLLISSKMSNIPSCSCGKKFVINVRKDSFIKSCNCYREIRYDNNKAVTNSLEANRILIEQTKDILPLSINPKIVADLKINIRKYIVKNKITELPVCKWCFSPDLSFHGGFSSNCSSKECVALTRKNKSMYKMVSNTRTKIFEYLLKENIEVLRFPDKNIRDGKSTIRCTRCQLCTDETLGCGLYKTIKCKNCNPVISTCSKPEIEVFEFVKDLCYKKGIICISSDRRMIAPLELDIVTDTFAIEFNGIYWHSSPRKDEDYHQIKTDLVEEKGLQLFHILENDWKYRKHIWKSIINKKMGNHRTVNSSSCIIKLLDDTISDNFILDNCLEGSVIGEIKLGLYLKEELVSVMIFSSETGNRAQYELAIFADKLNTLVIDSNKTLLEYFESTYKPRSLFCKINRSHKSDTFCKDNHFVFLGKTPPSRSYIHLRDDNTIKDAYIADKNVLLERGYYEIYDSGYSLYGKKYPVSQTL